jgi:hypothetical protein
MKMAQISTFFDWLHARLPTFCRRLFIAAAMMLGVGMGHFILIVMNASYRARVFAQYDAADLQQSILPLPIGQIFGVIGSLLFVFWCVLFLLRVVLSLRAKLWRRAVV